MSERPRRYIRVYSENQLEDLWSYYRRFEVIRSVRREFGASAENAEAAADCVRQAREFAISAASASLITRPILLYYSMVNLAKVSLLLDQTQPTTIGQIEEYEENDGHGLRTTDPASKSSQRFALERMTVRVTSRSGRGGILEPSGLFMRFALHVTGPPASDWLGKSASVKDLLRAVPQLDDLLVEVFDEANGYRGLQGHVAHYMGQTASGAEVVVPHLMIDLTKNRVQTPEQARRKLTYLSRAHRLIPSAMNQREYELSCDPDEAVQRAVHEEFLRSEAVLPPALHGVRLNSLLAQYMLMYTLSIVARYKPHRWARLLEGRETPLLPLVERLMFISSRWWPNLLLNRLVDAQVTFAPASRLG
jgi:hypothetical protein